jgi:hypothetical protein
MMAGSSWFVFTSACSAALGECGPAEDGTILPPVAQNKNVDD